MNLSKGRLLYISWIGGLTFLAGAINLCGAILFGLTTSHYTGNVSHAAMALSGGEYKIFVSIISIIFLFGVGATISGFLFNESKVDIRRYYSLIPIVFGIIVIVTFYITNNKHILLCLFALGMGVQNATWLKVEGIPVRTTHMTGYLSDAAFYIGAVLRGQKEEIWKVRFYLFSIMSFFTGGIFSTIITKMIGLKAILVIAGFYIALGIHIHIILLLDNKQEHILRKQGLHKINQQEELC